MSENVSKLAARQGIKNTLFEALQVPAREGKQTHSEQLAKQFLLGEAKIVGAASFYDFIDGPNANKKAYICNGSSCLCAGQEQVHQTLNSFLDSSDIGHVTCLGRCHENRAFQVDGRNYSGSDIDQITQILAVDTEIESQEDYQVVSPLAAPVFTAELPDITDYYQLFTNLIANSDSESVLTTLAESNLRGRGGAGFPTAIKWRAARDASSTEKYIVCNADEGDPGAFSDRYLLEQRPHTVLLGMLIAGWISGARWGVLYIRDEYPESIHQCERAIEELTSLDICKHNDWQFTFKIIRGAGAYICGEETALLRSIEGQRPMVSVRPPFPVEKGLFQQPTILNNVETFAAVPWIITHGAAAFAAMGNGKSTGSKLVSLDGSFNRPGIYEVPMSLPLAELVELAGGYARPVKALHIGGPLGGLVPLSCVDKLKVDFESFAEHGFLLGHASIIGIPESMPIVEYIKHLFAFTAAESCGKCFPCRLGATRGTEMFDNAITQKHLIDGNLLNDLLDTMQHGSLCALGGGVPLPVRNALEHFADELSPYFAVAEATQGEK